MFKPGWPWSSKIGNPQRKQPESLGHHLENSCPGDCDMNRKWTCPKLSLWGLEAAASACDHFPDYFNLPVCKEPRWPEGPGLGPCSTGTRDSVYWVGLCGRRFQAWEEMVQKVTAPQIQVMSQFGAGPPRCWRFSGQSESRFSPKGWERKLPGVGGC